MASEGAGAATSTASTDGISNQLAILVPSFDPSVDSVETWASKIELLTKAWPSGKLLELATRIVLNCKGTAYQKLQPHAQEVLVNDQKGIKRIVELVGGAWGQVPLEKTYELIEKAFFRCSQKADELSDSYLSRCDVIWSDLLMRGIDMKQVQAYVILRGSRLTSDDKKRVIVECRAESSGTLEVKKVSQAIRMLGSGFFQEYTGGHRDKQLKTYDHTAFAIEEVVDEPEAETYWMTEDSLDEEALEILAAQDDEDASMILQFEDAVVENLQQDPELSAYFSTYQEARRRLSEKVKTRGFWPIRKGEKGKGFGKGKTKGKFPRSLSSRIASSYCRICHKKGHWKNECPDRIRDGSKSSSSATTVPTSFAYASEVPPEIEQIPLMNVEESLSESQSVECLFGLVGQGFKKGFHHDVFQRGYNQNLRKSLQQSNRLSGISHHEPREPIVNPVSESESSAECLFVSTGTQGVVDLGASQTVIGSAQVPELLKQLPSKISSQIRRVGCNLVFRFGNQQTLASHHALMIPLRDQWFRIAVVPSKTPFLLSSSFLRYTLQAIIDTEKNTLYSKRLKRHLPLEVTSKNLYIMNLNHLWEEEISEGSQGEEIHPIHMTSIDSAWSDLPVQNMSSRQPGHEQVKRVSSKPSESLGHDNKIIDGHSLICDTSAKEGPDRLIASVPPVVDQDCSCAQQVPSNHVGSDSTSSAVPSSAEGVPRGDHGSRSTTDDAGGIVTREDRIWEGTCGNTLSRDVPEQQLHGLVCGDVSQIPQAGSSEVCPLRGAAPRPRVGFRFSDNTRTISQSQSQGSSDTTDSRPNPKGSEGVDRTLGSSGTSGRDRRGVRDATPSAISPHGRASELDAGGEQESQPAHEQDGDQCRGDLAALASDGHQEGAMSEEAMITSDLDWDFDFITHQRSKTFRRKCDNIIQKINQELREVSNELDRSRIQNKVSHADLVEVMCHDQSEQVAQCSRLGGVTFRFGLKEGDLSTTVGRKELFRLICSRQPTHIWFSPKCGPWSMWSNFNMNRSKEGESRILQEREDSLWQIKSA